MSEKIVLVAKSRDEKELFDKLDNYQDAFYHDDLGNSSITEFAQNNTKVYLLRHFGAEIASSVSELCKIIREWKKEINEEKVIIIPISEGGSAKIAKDLYEEIKANKNPVDIGIAGYAIKWKELCKENLKKKKILNILPFCLYCESIKRKESLLDNKDFKEKVKDSLLEILKKTNDPVLHWGNLEHGGYWEELNELFPKNENQLVKEDILTYIRSDSWKNMLEYIKNQ